jgi:hypothetical protein
MPLKMRGRDDEVAVCRIVSVDSIAALEMQRRLSSGKIAERLSLL